MVISLLAIWVQNKKPGAKRLAVALWQPV